MCPALSLARHRNTVLYFDSPFARIAPFYALDVIDAEATPLPVVSSSGPNCPFCSFGIVATDTVGYGGDIVTLG